MDELIGKKIENYQILSILGKGGMGIVYKARDEKLDRFVAIKFLAAEMVNKPNLAERFKREAKNHAQLLHPNIVTVYGFIEYKNLYGIVMEFVEGESLEKVLFRNSRLHIYDVVYIMRQVLLAIGYAHSKGFIHRDIKPSNIILNSEGTVKIMDFGISKSIFDKDMTLTGSKVGTVFYMSPEQIKGNNISYLSDIYSLGCTMFEMITGQPPFYSDTEYDVMDGHLKKDPPKISDFVPGVPPDLEKIISKCLQKQSELRYKSCGDIIDDLHLLDKYLETVNSKYFLRKKKNPKFVKIKSIAFLSLLIVAFLGLFYFAYVQVDAFIKARLYENMDKIDFSTLSISGKDNLLSIYPVKNNIKQNLKSAFFKSVGQGVVVGDSFTVKYTNDSCKSWESVKKFSNDNIFDIEFFHNGYYAVGGQNYIFKYSNDFLSSVVLNLGENLNLFRIKSSNNKIFSLGAGGNVFSSDDGTKWKRSKLNTSETLFDLDFFDENRGVIVGWNGTILVTKNGGLSWSKIQAFTKKYLKSVSLNSNGTGVIVGAGGGIFRTQDFGETWIEIKNELKEGMQSVEFITVDFVIAVGNRGAIAFSNDSGFNWEILNSGTKQNLNKIIVTNSKTKGYIVGNNGAILKFDLRE
ncbi:MAG: hypothetical protein Fur0015_12090 [Ignavibacteriales bacterium]